MCECTRNTDSDQHIAVALSFFILHNTFRLTTLQHCISLVVGGGLQIQMSSCTSFAVYCTCNLCPYCECTMPCSSFTVRGPRLVNVTLANFGNGNFCLSLEYDQGVRKFAFMQLCRIMQLCRSILRHVTYINTVLT